MDLQKIPNGVSVFRMEHETIEKIEAALQAADRSKNWVAKKSGISASTLHRKLHGGGAFTIPEIVRIANALRISPIELLPSEFEAVAA